MQGGHVAGETQRDVNYKAARAGNKANRENTSYWMYIV